jgi:hypothetical protein
VIKESICRSEEIDKLSSFEESLFYRLIVNVDDFGRFDGRTSIIRAACFPLKDVTNKTVGNALDKLAEVGLIKFYNVDGKPYLELVTWGKHQRLRETKPKYPECPGESNFNSDVGFNAAVSEFEDKVTAFASEIAEAEPEKPFKSEQNVKPEQTKEPKESIKIISLPLNTGEEYPVTKSDLEEWMELYPAVDVMQELRSMRGWCLQNKAKRKTAKGIGRFINSWLARTQNAGGTPGYVRQSGYAGLAEKLLNENRSDLS